jgi:peptide/nickel transport system ATP-binding protein
MIAMAISCNPSLLIADEPTTALDVTVQKTILELIKDLQIQMGMGVILITHDLGLVADIADRVLVMYKGEIAEQGKTTAVLQAPQHPYTKALMACRPAMHQRGERLPVVSDFMAPLPPKEGTKIGVPAGSDLSFEARKETLQPAVILKDETEISQQKIENSKPLTTGETVLRVENLKVYYPGKKALFGKTPPPFKALDDVSFMVGKGETIGLVGESGCGKTTLGRAILQLIPVTSGNIILNGTNLAGLSKAAMQPVRKDLQIVFQDPYGSLNPRLTIGAAIQEPMLVHGILKNSGERRDKVIELLEKVNLNAEHFNRYPHQFSGGQRQRICIARALALNPSFLIFDESVSALDVSVQAQVLNLLNELKKEFGFTAIFISHDLSVVRFISDRIMVMNQGKIIEEGLSDKIYFSPENEYTKKLIAAIPGKKINIAGA